jgi:hypothetical protein
MLEVTLAGGEAPPFKLPIIFPDKLVHVDVAAAMREVVKSTWKKCKVTYVSAGSVHLDDVHCSGKSESMELESRRTADNAVINMYDYLHGVET